MTWYKLYTSHWSRTQCGLGVSNTALYLESLVLSPLSALSVCEVSVFVCLIIRAVILKQMFPCHSLPDLRPTSSLRLPFSKCWWGHPTLDLARFWSNSKHLWEWESACCACVLCVCKAVAVPVCSRSQWTVHSSRPSKVSVHSTHEDEISTFRFNNVTWNRAFGTTLMKNDVTVLIVVDVLLWYCLWL